MTGPNFKDLTGLVFGKYTVIGRVSRSELSPNESRAMWRVQCSCGSKEMIKPSTELTKGRAISCRLCRINRQKIRLNEVEKRLKKENLVLIYYPGKTRNKVKFFCHCGKEGEARASAIFDGKVKSCGCTACPTGKDSPNWKGFGEISASYFKHIEVTAILRGLDFNITIKEIWDLFLKQKRRCVFSGEKLEFEKGRQKIKRTASLDRIDSSKGYSVDNVQWVHKRINIMKGNMSDTEFLKWVSGIYNYSCPQE